MRRGWDERGEEKGDETRETTECFRWISQVKHYVMSLGRETTNDSSYSTVEMTCDSRRRGA